MASRARGSGVGTESVRPGQGDGSRGEPPLAGRFLCSIDRFVSGINYIQVYHVGTRVAYPYPRVRTLP